VAPWFRERTRAAIVERARELRVPLAPVRSVDEVLADVQLEHRGFFRTVGGVRVPGLPVDWQRSHL
jgi:crotonobetainyl-CoA:carnitine CoA-transferase CaiB-like acyl-CoA transferase